MNVMLDSAIVMRNLGRGEGTRDDDDSIVHALRGQSARAGDDTSL